MCFLAASAEHMLARVVLVGAVFIAWEGPRGRRCVRACVCVHYLRKQILAEHAVCFHSRLHPFALGVVIPRCDTEPVTSCKKALDQKTRLFDCVVCVWVEEEAYVLRSRINS